MILSSSKKPKLKFIQASQHIFLSNTDYRLVRAATRFHLMKAGHIVKWEPLGGFHTVEAAESFINKRDYMNATEDSVGVSSDDFAFVIEAYNFELLNENSWAAKVGGYTLVLTFNGTELVLNIERGNEVNVKTFDTVQELLLELDSFYTDEDIYSSKALHVGSVITAAINVRDLSKNLVRVKSSNIWAYGMNLRDRKDKTGEVVVQFKGNKGGPGDVYIYYDVPLVVWRKWLSATSKGHYFWMYIRNTYMYSKLTGDKRGKLKNAINR